MRMLTLLCAPHKWQCGVSWKWWENSIIKFSIHIQNIPHAAVCDSSATWQEKHHRLSQQYSFLKEADLLMHVWWKRITESSPGQLYLLYFSRCVWCLVAMVLWESWLGCVMGWWLRGFSWPLEWADCGLTVTQSQVYLYTLWWRAALTGPLSWASGGDSSRWWRSKRWTATSYIMLTFHWTSSVFPLVFDGNTQQQVGPSLQFSWLDTPV